MDGLETVDATARLEDSLSGLLDKDPPSLWCRNQLRYHAQIGGAKRAEALEYRANGSSKSSARSGGR